MLKSLNKDVVRVAGLMSGTSADGVDVAIVDIGRRGLKTVAFGTYPYPAGLRRRIFELFDPRSGSVDKICHMNAVLGEVFASAVLQLCRDKRVRLSSIDLIGSHGQTIWHQPDLGGMPSLKRQGKAWHPSRVSSTLQIGEPSIIAQRTGITTVADFRPRDMAAGGQGAPLVPFADMVLLGHPTLTRAVQNIGGIANVTFLPKGTGQGTGSGVVCRCLSPLSRPNPPCSRRRERSATGRKQTPDLSACALAFDTGPGNMIIDRITQHITGGRQSFDRGGKLAAEGDIDRRLLGRLLRHPYLRRRPPKTTGREMFGVQFADELWARTRTAGTAPLDVLATATAFTAATIADAYRRLLPRLPDEMILCGGGARNATLVAMLQRELADVRVVTMDELGINADAKEAISFAILAYATIKGIPSNVPAATGASEPVVLGKIVPGSSVGRERARAAGFGGYR